MGVEWNHENRVIIKLATLWDHNHEGRVLIKLVVRPSFSIPKTFQGFSPNSNNRETQTEFRKSGKTGIRVYRTSRVLVLFTLGGRELWVQ